MTVLTIVLQMPKATTAATIVRVKDASRHHTHHSSGSDESDSGRLVDTVENDDSSSSHSIEDIDNIVEIIMKKTDNLKRTRKAKRHSDDLYLLHHQQESSTDLEWVNPCSGVFELSEESNSENPPPSYYLSKLRKVADSEFHTINDTMHTIDVSDMAIWSKYRKYYSFLPKISLDSNIALKRWYRHMQTYVAAFAYLGRTQYKWDRTNRMSISSTTHELNQLLLSARSILCEIETTINGSYPYPSNQPKLTAITREAMNRRLRFLTKRHINPEHIDDEAIEPQMLDLQYTKSKYYHYLRRMWRVIRLNTKRKGQRRLSSLGLSNESSASASVSATIEDLIAADMSDLRSQENSSLSSSASASFEQSKEQKSRRNRRPHRQHKQERKSSQKSAELPRL